MPDNKIYKLGGQAVGRSGDQAIQSGGGLIARSPDRPTACHQ
jgi:hypothetical protein